MKKLSVICAMLLVATCGKPAAEKLVIYSPHPLKFIEAFTPGFTEETGIPVEIITAGGGELFKRIEAEKAKPLGDILWGTTISLAGSIGDNFQPYASTNEDSVIDAFKNTDGRYTAFTTVPSVIMVNTDLTKDIKIEGYADLLNPALKGKIAFADPNLSSSSWEQLVNMLYAMGDGKDPETGWAFVEKLLANINGKVLSSSGSVYKGVADGEYSVGLTFEEGALNYINPTSPVAVVYMKEGVISRPDGVYIIKGAAHPEAAKAFVDYVTSKKAQDLLEGLNRRSIRKDVTGTGKIKPNEEILMINDDPAYATQKKTEWLNKFKDIYAKSVK